jgi:hypothetical protein
MTALGLLLANTPVGSIAGKPAGGADVRVGPECVRRITPLSPGGGGVGRLRRRRRGRRNLVGMRGRPLLLRGRLAGGEELRSVRVLVVYRVQLEQVGSRVDGGAEYWLGLA